MTAPTPSEIAAAAALTWAAVVWCVGFETIRRMMARRRGAPARGQRSTRSIDGDRRPIALLVRPLSGASPWALRAVLSASGARRSFDLRVRVAVESEADEAHPAAVRACEELAARGVDARVALTSARAPNRKAAQIAAVIEAERAPFDWLIVADADVDLDGADLDALTAPLRAGSAASWAPPIELDAGRSLGDRASAAVLGASLHAFPLLAGLDPSTFVGKLFAIDRVALDAVGGFGALTEHLGEDIELCRRLRARGLDVAAAQLAARSLTSGRSFGDAAARFGRWLAVIRAQRPWLLASYPLLFFATPLLVALAIVTLPSAPRAAIAAALLAIVSRVSIAAAAALSAGRPVRRAIADAWLADVLLAVAFARALRSRIVIWHGVSLTLDRAGRIYEKSP